MTWGTRKLTVIVNHYTEGSIPIFAVIADSPLNPVAYLKRSSPINCKFYIIYS